MTAPIPNCLILLRHVDWRAFSLAAEKTGNNKAARMAIMVMTTSNSMSVKAAWRIGTHLQTKGGAL
jgi:hypothetical protein